jgi:hypothetical protein
MASYPTDNPMDGRGGEVAAGRAAMPEETPDANQRAARLRAIVATDPTAAPEMQAAAMDALMRTARFADAMPQILAALRECETHFAILVDFDAEDDTAARNLKLVRDAIAAAKGR